MLVLSVRLLGPNLAKPNSAKDKMVTNTYKIYIFNNQFIRLDKTV